ncbi:MAG: IPT/TIG domain-containing protein [Treponema sp.]|nr:IPT/TIG domain-containing protein [Treponema sp.]
MILKTIRELWRRSPLFRVGIWLALIIIVLFSIPVAGKTKNKKPEIVSVMPPTGSPGDVIVIQGSGFGDTKESSFVEISGSRITTSGIKFWSDTRIEFVVPYNIQDGLLCVQTSAGRSEPNFFANSAGIPVTVRTDPRISLPVLDSISVSSASVGDSITLTGSNFGAVRAGSQVFFTADLTQAINLSLNENQEFIAANEQDYDYESWSDTEIKVRVPDGAATGPVYVHTDKGNSLRQQLTLSAPAGKKTLSSMHTYVVKVSADVQNRDIEQENRVTFFMPRPAQYYSQPKVSVDAVDPIPLIQDDPFDMIHQVTLNPSTTEQIRFNQNYVINAFSVSSGIDSSKVKAFSAKSRLLYSVYTAPDSCVPSDDEKVKALAQEIIGKNKNPYIQAKAIYDYMVTTYQIEEEVRTGSISVTDMLESGSGDAYDFAMLFTALCRSVEIPCASMGGVLVDSKTTCKAHWWAEVYFEKYGWFPVDVALGAGLPFNSFTPVENPTEYYFGNQEGQHIAFSRKVNSLKPSLLNSRTVYRPRTYALQSIWEEASNATASYSSLWNDPVIVGIY